MSDARARWDARWEADASLEPGAAHPLVRELAQALAPGARVLDVAAGRGRQGLALAGAGHRVTAADVSPVGLRRLRHDALQHGVQVETRCADLAVGLPPALSGPWEAVVCVDYFAPELWPHLREALRPGGLLVLSLATTHNLQRHARPSQRFLVEARAGARAIGGLRPRVVSADWRANGRHELWVWGRRPGGGEEGGG